MKNKIYTKSILGIIALVVIIGSALLLIKPNFSGNFLSSKTQCSDGIDNDGDTAIDLQDTGCSSKSDNDESYCGDRYCSYMEDGTNCPIDCIDLGLCSDTDPTNNPFVAGNCTSQGTSYEDWCYYEDSNLISPTGKFNTLIQTYCDLNFCKGTWESCPNGYYCEGGKCIAYDLICGDGLCIFGENCPGDVVNCNDGYRCYEPECTNGCNLVPVPARQTDELCYGNVGCQGAGKGTCVCDGIGKCVASTKLI